MNYYKKSGFTLLEVAIAVALFGTFMAFATFTISYCYELHKQTILAEYLNTQAELILQKIAKDLQDISIAHMAPPYPADSNKLRFKKIISVDQQGNNILGNDIEWAFDQNSAGELDNNHDDNNNKLIDEGYLVRREYDSEGKMIRQTIISRHVMEKDAKADQEGLNGISFTRIGEMKQLIVSLSLQKIGPRQRIMRVNKQTLVTLQ